MYLLYNIVSEFKNYVDLVRVLFRFSGCRLVLDAFHKFVAIIQ